MLKKVAQGVQIKAQGFWAGILSTGRNRGFKGRFWALFGLVENSEQEMLKFLMHRVGQKGGQSPSEIQAELE